MEKPFMAEQSSDRPLKIVRKMLANDSFSQWMGVEIVEVKEGFCKIACTIDSRMLNGFQVTHGGIVFSLADSALAFSAATYGRIALAIDNSISFIKKTKAGDRLVATSKCRSLTHKTGVFEITVTNANGEVLALMKGTVYRTGEEFEI